MDFKEVQEQVKKLEDTVNGKDLEIRLLEMELIDIHKPINIISETQGLYLEMLSEINKFIKTKGKSEKATTGQKRILRLMELNEQLSSISEANNSQKLFIRELHANYQLLRIENLKLKQQLNKSEQAENF